MDYTDKTLHSSFNRDGFEIAVFTGPDPILWAGNLYQELIDVKKEPLDETSVQLNNLGEIPDPDTYTFWATLKESGDSEWFDRAVRELKMLLSGEMELMEIAVVARRSGLDLGHAHRGGITVSSASDLETAIVENLEDMTAEAISEAKLRIASLVR